MVLWASGGGWENAWNTPRISSVPPGVWEFLSRTRVSEVSVRGGRKGTQWLSLAGACLCLMEFLQGGFNFSSVGGSDTGSALHRSLSLSIMWNFMNWDRLEKRMQPHFLVTEPRRACCICQQSFRGGFFFFSYFVNVSFKLYLEKSVCVLCSK